MKARFSFILVSLVLAVAARAEDKIKIACVGDSITAGAGIRDPKLHYPTQLGVLLGDKYEVKNFGNSGSTLLKKGDKPYWKQNEFKGATDFAPNIVVIKLGTNDSKPQNMKFKEEFATDLAAMVDHFAGLASKPKIYLCLPVPAYKTQWGINEAGIQEMVVPAIKKVAVEKKAEIIDLHTPLSNHAEMFPDAIHPNGDGAALMAKAVAEALKK